MFCMALCSQIITVQVYTTAVSDPCVLYHLLFVVGLTNSVLVCTTLYIVLGSISYPYHICTNSLTLSSIPDRKQLIHTVLWEGVSICNH